MKRTRFVDEKNCCFYFDSKYIYKIIIQNLGSNLFRVRF